MSDVTPSEPESDPNPGANEPRHRRDDVPVDGVQELDLSDFGENPDTEVAG